MEHLLTACSCGLDPATESMVLNVGIAAGLSVPFWFRDQVANVVRRLRGSVESSEACADDRRDEPPSN